MEFKLEDDGKNIKIQIFQDSMEKIKPSIKNYYMALRKFLRAKQSRDKEKILTWEASNDLGLPTKLTSDDHAFQIKRYDERSIPADIKVSGDHFVVRIRITSYEEI